MTLRPFAPAAHRRFGEFYAALLATGMRPTMARLTVARKTAAIVLIMWKKGERFDPGQLKRQVVVEGFDDHAEDANPARSILAACGLTRAVTASMVEAWGCAVFSTGRTLVSTKFVSFTVSLAAVAGTGVASLTFVPQ